MASSDSDADVLIKGTRVMYMEGDGNMSPARVLRVHHDDQPPYYTISITGQGREKQTVREKLHQVPQECAGSRLRSADMAAQRILGAAPRDSLAGREDRKVSEDAPAPRAASSAGMWTLYACALLLRHAVGLYPHSGRHDPPMYGDYEAQRHWMEVTLNLDLRDWYFDTAQNDLQYWGLDYPPLSAYFARAAGWASRLVDPASVALLTSRGYDTDLHRAFMRLSVVLCDAALFLPAALLLCRRLYPRGRGEDANASARHLAFACVAFCPPLLLIDHGHFQYNSVMLGLSLLALWLLSCQQRFLAAVAFCLALNFKQTALYYAPVFGLCLLGWCCGLEAGTGTDLRSDAFASLRDRRSRLLRHKRRMALQGYEYTGAIPFIAPLYGLRRFAARFLYLSAAVLFTFAALWAPFCVCDAKVQLAPALARVAALPPPLPWKDAWAMHARPPRAIPEWVEVDAANATNAEVTAKVATQVVDDVTAEAKAEAAAEIAEIAPEAAGGAPEAAEVTAQDAAQVTAQVTAQDAAQVTAQDAAQVTAQDAAQVTAQVTAEGKVEAAAEPAELTPDTAGGAPEAAAGAASAAPAAEIPEGASAAAAGSCAAGGGGSCAFEGTPTEEEWEHRKWRSRGIAAEDLVDILRKYAFYASRTLDAVFLSLSAKAAASLAQLSQGAAEAAARARPVAENARRVAAWGAAVLKDRAAQASGAGAAFLRNAFARRAAVLRLEALRALEAVAPAAHEARGCLRGAAQVLRRVFPLGRGLFEDKVGNFWYALSIFVDLRGRRSEEHLALLALLATALALLAPAALALLRLPALGASPVGRRRRSRLKELAERRERLRRLESNPVERMAAQRDAEALASLVRGEEASGLHCAPDPRMVGQLLGLASCALCFFLFSFQVHEKAILLAALPAVALAPLDPPFAALLSAAAAFGMFPLLKRDGLAAPYILLAAASAAAVALLAAQRGLRPIDLEAYAPTPIGDCGAVAAAARRTLRWLRGWPLALVAAAAVAGMAAVHAAERLYAPPAHLPDLHALLFSVGAFCMYAAAAAYAVLWQAALA